MRLSLLPYKFCAKGDDAISQEKLLVTDVNGTIHSGHDGIPVEVLAAFEHLQESGYITTITTGRSVKRANELLGAQRDQIVTSGSPLSLENGGRLLGSDLQNIKYYPIPNDILRASVALSLEVETTYVAFSPKEPQSPIQIWLSPGQNPNRFIKENGTDVTVHGGKLVDFARTMHTSEPCMIRVGTSETNNFANFPDASVFLNQGEVNILACGVSKARGVVDIAEYFGIELKQVLVAGNDSNDIPMFELPVGASAFVETEAGEFLMPDNVLRFPNIKSFGNYLVTVC